MNIKKNIKKSLVLEGRKEDAYEKYISKAQPGAIKNKLISSHELFTSEDPSGNHKYLDWMMKTLLGIILDGGVITDDSVEKSILDIVKRFHTQLPRLEKKDLNQYKNLRDLSKAIEAAEAKTTRKEEKLKGADKIYEDDNLTVIQPKTKEGSCLYGSETRWCVAARDGNQYNNYSSRGTLYYIIWKLKMPTHLKQYQKIARYLVHGKHYEFEGEYFTSNDSRIDEYQIEYNLFGINNEYSKSIGYTIKEVPERSRSVYNSWEQAKIKIDTHYAMNGMKKAGNNHHDDWGDEDMWDDDEDFELDDDNW